MGRGRPKGSKNKKTLTEPGNSEAIVKRGRGRPRKNKAIERIDPVINIPLVGNFKDIKKEIRQLRKLKLQCRPGSEERIDLEHKIKALKKQLEGISISEPGKDKIITEILKIEAEQKITPRFADLFIDLHKFTEAELQKHLDIIKKKFGLDR
jgi:hypothetical protein